MQRKRNPHKQFISFGRAPYGVGPFRGRYRSVGVEFIPAGPHSIPTKPSRPLTRLTTSINVSVVGENSDLRKRPP